jgi:hypothetical protein
MSERVGNGGVTLSRGWQMVFAAHLVLTLVLAWRVEGVAERARTGAVGEIGADAQLGNFMVVHRDGECRAGLANYGGVAGAVSLVTTDVGTVGVMAKSGDSTARVAVNGADDDARIEISSKGTRIVLCVDSDGVPCVEGYGTDGRRLWRVPE